MHIVVAAATDRWNGLLPYVNSGKGYIASDGASSPASVAAGRWVKKLGVKSGGQLLPRYDKDQPTTPGGPRRGLRKPSSTSSPI